MMPSMMIPGVGSPPLDATLAIVVVGVEITVSTACCVELREADVVVLDPAGIGEGVVVVVVVVVVFLSRFLRLNAASLFFRSWTRLGP